MPEASNQWSLFGFDTRHLLQHLLGAWRELLFASTSPLRRRLDEPVWLHDGAAARLYQGGVVVDARTVPGAPGSVARLLPDSMCLVRELAVPVAVEAELPSVLAMEARASSPFAADDTASGWCESGRDDERIGVVLAMASRSAVQRWLSEQPATAVAPEVWVARGEGHVVLEGFGEYRRERAYRRRLLRCAAMGAASLVVVLLCAGLYAWQQQRLLEHREAQFAAVRERAAGVVAARAELARANETIALADTVATAYADPQLELARLSALLDDQAYVAHFSLRGRDLRIRGEARNAAQVMQTVAEESAYVGVSAPTAIRAGGGDREQFQLDIALRGDPGDGA